MVGGGGRRAGWGGGRQISIDPLEVFLCERGLELASSDNQEGIISTRLPTNSQKSEI